MAWENLNEKMFFFKHFINNGFILKWNLLKKYKNEKKTIFGMLSQKSVKKLKVALVKKLSVKSGLNLFFIRKMPNVIPEIVMHSKYSAFPA